MGSGYRSGQKSRRVIAGMGVEGDGRKARRICGVGFERWEEGRQNPRGVIAEMGVRDGKKEARRIFGVGFERWEEGGQNPRGVRWEEGGRSQENKWCRV